MKREIQRIVVTGPAEAAAAACALAISLRGSGMDIVFAKVPGDEPALPFVLGRGGGHGFHQLLGLDEAGIMASSGGRYLLGTRFRGFLDPDRDVTVPLGSHGEPLRLVDLHQHVARLTAAGEHIALNDLSLPAVAARSGSFDPARAAPAPAGRTLGYDLCLDRERYAAHMCRLATDAGVSAVSGNITAVHVDEGLVTGLELDGGKAIPGDLFVDCSSSRVVASRIVAEPGFQDWSTWFPCNRTAALSADPRGGADLLATIEADDFGWTKQTHVNDMLVHTYGYSSNDLEDDTARDRLAGRLGGIDPAHISVTELRTGRQSEHWVGNCVALGPAGATFEPMDVSPMHLLQGGVLRLLAMLPRERRSPNLAEEFNRATNTELDEIRDYQLLRYALATRTQGPFWEHVAEIKRPASLRGRIDLFMTHGRFTRGEPALFGKAQWISSFVNFGAEPLSYDPVADMIDVERTRAELHRFRAIVAAAASG